MRHLALLLCLLPLLSYGQETAMDKPTDGRMTWNYSGTFELPPTHPSCGELAVEPRKACTPEHVLAEIKSRVKAVPPATKPPESVMITVDFDVNQFGEVKQIKVDYAGDAVLANQIIVALYGLPKFIPANNAGARVASHCTFAYAPSLLFEEAPAK